ncbi:MAG: ABC transporter permease [Geobacteraceae bacterium]|nr:ABC transporter permease [Geobacteraceae bacterium]
MISSLGRSALSAYITISEILALLTGVMGNISINILRIRRPVIQVLLRQIFFTGNEAFKVIFLISMAVGIAIISQMSNVADAGRGSLIGKVFVWVVIREVAPLITALVVIARSGSAIAIEMGQMKLEGEIEYLEALGIPGEQYLLMPRVLGAGIALLVLNVYFNLIAISSGLIVSWLAWQIPLAHIKQGLISVLNLKEVIISSAKSLLFGIVIAAVGCNAGLRVGDSITEIPQAGTRSVINSLVIVFVADVFISFTFLF